MSVTIRCLLVDDSPSFLEAAADLLKREGVTVVGIASAIADALRQARELRPDVVLVDVVLGRENGFDLAQRLDETDSGDTTVILTSTLTEEDLGDLIEEMPVAGFVTKSELSARAIRQLMPAASG